MADVRCPLCGNANTKEAEYCRHCGTRIKPTLPSTPNGIQPIHAGDRPVIRDTSEFETEKLPDSAAIHAGEVPTDQDSADLEKTLPTWLRSVRSGQETDNSQASRAEAPAAELPPSSPVESGSPPGNALNDWLAGLETVGKDELEASPDWLSNVRSDQIPEADRPMEAENNPASVENEWIARLGQEASGRSSEAPQEPRSVLRPAKDDRNPSSPTAGGEEHLPDWLSTLPSVPAANTPAVPGEAPDWLNQFKNQAIDLPASDGNDGRTEISMPAGSEGSEEREPLEFPRAEKMPDWLSKMGGENQTRADSIPPGPAREQPQTNDPSGKVPTWLSQLQADASAGMEAEADQGKFDVAEPSRGEKKDTGPLPEWLSGIEKPPSQTRATPALISEEKSNPGESGGPPAFSMETPDWLSKIKPEQGAEKSSDTAAEQAQDSLEVAELPSWVQAMRPVEAVVSEAKGTGGDEQTTEENGPLAGLRGVLPASPGIGKLRKPPTYSAKLQVSEGQQRYAAYLDKLIASEAQPKSQAIAHLRASRIWRWVITLILFTSVLASLGLRIEVPPNSLAPSDAEATRRLIDAIPANAPVLAAFDYDPALSGELTAVAAPIFDQLLSKGIRLVVISTTPTGPILANQFLEDAILVNIYNYLSRTGSQYLNLGYLAGGPAGIQYFAVSPREAMLVDATGNLITADLSVLQGVTWLSDFSALIVLTDNADTGRSWIEQAGPQLGSTPMIMVSSSQAEPMIRPYYDSGQIKGLVSGLVDGKAYEQLYGRPGLADYYWGTLSIATLTAEALIVLGAAINLLVGLTDRRSKSRKAAGA